MPLLEGYRRERTLAPSPLHLRRTRDRDGWCDATAHPAYNRPVTLPFAASHERMDRADGLYDYCLVLDWNIRSRRRNRGSAIFLHLARPGYEPTEGCVAVSVATMRRLLPHLSSRAVLTVVR